MVTGLNFGLPVTARPQLGVWNAVDMALPKLLGQKSQNLSLGQN